MPSFSSFNIANERSCQQTRFVVTWQGELTSLQRENLYCIFLVKASFLPLYCIGSTKVKTFFWSENKHLTSLYSFCAFFFNFSWSQNPDLRGRMVGKTMNDKIKEKHKNRICCSIFYSSWISFEVCCIITYARGKHEAGLEHFLSGSSLSSCVW